MRAPWTALLMIVAATPVFAQAPAPPADSVVRIESTHQLPDYYRPWQRRTPESASGSGVVIDGSRILTNAHVVNYATDVLVQASRGGRKIPAKVVAIAPGIDLALLEVDDPGFFEKAVPMAFADELPEEKESVVVYGFPMGGAAMSVTQGIVSRIEYEQYYFDEMGLRIQVDAALNPGNSGGPATVDGRLIGLVFSSIEEAENIGYVIPVEEIRWFLEDVADGRYDGKPRIKRRKQTFENDALRAKVGVPSDVSGLLITDMPEDDSVFMRWDVVTHVGEHAVDDRGYSVMASGKQILSPYFVPASEKDGVVPHTIWRAGESIVVNVPVERRRDRVFPYLYDGYPSYTVMGPYVFSPVTADLAHGFVGAYGWLERLVYRGSPLVTRLEDDTEFEGEQLVALVCPAFPHSVGRGYDVHAPVVVKSVNDVPIQNFRHFIEVIRDTAEEFVTIAFHENDTETIVLRRSEIDSATESILQNNGIRRRSSPDVADLWPEE